jgi:hypothetical protein
MSTLTHPPRTNGANLDEAETPRTAVINPYALSELVAGRPIAWKQIEDRPRLLEEILQTPYAELFDPKYGSPLYAGFKLDEKRGLVRDEAFRLADPEPEVNSDLERALDPDVSMIRRIGDLEALMGTTDLAGISVEYAHGIGSAIELRVRMSEPLRRKKLARVLTNDVLQTIVPFLVENGFNPRNMTWQDGGDFFEEGAEFFDPVQGAVANCYLIAAMSAVAWARPYDIAHRNRATGQGQTQFTDMVCFYDVVNGNARRDIEVTEATIASTATGSPVYCRSSEPGEIWPAVYEKAFAKWKTGVTHDHPDITATAWGDPCRASAELTGLSRSYYSTAALTANELWEKVRRNSLGGRTINPMTAWTYGSGEKSPDGVVYSEANLVAAHAYSVLGWAYDNGRKYIVLRNPWGQHRSDVRRTRRHDHALRRELVAPDRACQPPTESSRCARTSSRATSPGWAWFRSHRVIGDAAPPARPGGARRANPHAETTPRPQTVRIR